MMQRVTIRDALTLRDYEERLHLTSAVRNLRDEVRRPLRSLRSKRLWMVNSTAQGGGVAEMLPKLVTLLRDLGVETEWAVVGGDDERFFDVTKRIHNMLHGRRGRPLSREDRVVYQAASRKSADALAQWVQPDDLLVIHDPQPLGAGSILARELGVDAVWRCHVGLDKENGSTRAAWNFLKPWTNGYRRVVFSFTEYVPPFLGDRSAVIQPAIDPLTEKNRDLSIRQVAAVLSSARMDGQFKPALTPSYDEPAMRIQSDGSFAPADLPASIGLIHRPIVTQISRWDRLKGWQPLLDGFLRMKLLAGTRTDLPAVRARAIELSRLVLAGPDPSAVQDDPEGLAVFTELSERWRDLPAEVQDDVVLLMLPMSSRERNALMVNALQRCSSIVAQNSLQEGFGLTVTEGMWKQRPILGTQAVGIRNQVRNGFDGSLVNDPENAEELADAMESMLARPDVCDEWGRNGQRRVTERFLIFTQVKRWLSVLSTVAASSQPAD